MVDGEECGGRGRVADDGKDAISSREGRPDCCSTRPRGTALFADSRILVLLENAGLDWSNMSAWPGIRPTAHVDDALHGVWNGGLYRLKRLERAYRMPLRAQSQQNDMFPWRSHYEELIRNAHRRAPKLGLIARVEGAQTHLSSVNGSQQRLSGSCRPIPSRICGL